MKKTGKWIIILIVGFLFVLSGCSKDSTLDGTKENVENQADNSTGSNDDNTEMPIEDAEEDIMENMQIENNTQITEEENIIEKDSEQQTETLSSCIDSDDGLNYYVKGTVTIEINNTLKRYTDYCRTGRFEDYVYEYHCVNDTVASKNYECINGCSDGKCYQ